MISFNELYENDSTQIDEQKLKQFIAQLSDEEKAKLLNGTGMSIVDNIGASNGRVPGSGGQTHAIPRLGIPDIVVSDGPSGLRILNQRENDNNSYDTTGFPVETVVGCSWDRSLAYQVGKAIATETKEYGVDVLLAPGVNIQRNPLNGRNFEYFSEDPVLSGELGAAVIQGAQSIQVGTSLKHYAANNAETNRNFSNSLVSERALRELYLRPFEIAIKKAQPWTVMTSYNKLNHRYTSERHDLNKQLLRDEWGFDGLVMTDWFSAFPNKESLLDPAFVNDVSAQVASGNDLIMPSMDRQLAALTQDIKSGKISKADTDFAVANVLRLIAKTPYANKYQFSNQPNLKQHAQLARTVAAEGAVLLKNDQTLPLNLPQTKVAVFGVGGYHLITGGTGSSEVTTRYRISIEQGLLQAGAQVFEPLSEAYRPYVAQQVEEDIKRRDQLTKLEPFADLIELNVSAQMIQDAAVTADVAIYAIGRNSAEEHDQKLATDYYLRPEELSLIEQLSQAFHAQNKKLIVVLNIPTALDLNWQHYADAILISWYGGQEGGNAVADILGGVVNPSGKLTQSFAKNYEDLPSATSFFGIPAENPTDILYTEGIYVGYRYFERFQINPLYPFGFGLSYTDFTYSDLTLTQSATLPLKLSITVTNSGSVAGKEVAQLYVAASQGTIDKPKKVLVDFAKTKCLQPGESQTLQFEVDPKSMASFYPERAQWVLDAGQYALLAGGSSVDTPLQLKWQLEQEVILETVKPAFTEPLPFSDLTPTQ